MSYHHYTTEGIILKREDRGDNDAVYIVFTETLGLIVVYARGVRLLKSKLRFVLQLGNKVRITLVRGKALWRVTTCTLIYEVPLQVYPSLMRLYKLIRTHLVFDEPTLLLYGYMRDFVSVEYAIYMHQSRLRTAEIITTARILASLGILDDVQKNIDESPALTSAFCDSHQNDVLHLLKHIKNRLHESAL